MVKKIINVMVIVLVASIAVLVGAGLQQRHNILGPGPGAVEPTEPEVRIVYREADENHKASDAIASMILKLQPKLEPVIVKGISEAISKHSHEFDLPPELVIAVINKESTFRVLIASNKGAVGLMQVMPKAHRDKIKKLGIKRNEIYHIDHNIHLGCWILSDYYRETKSVGKALQRYLGGQSDKYVKDVLNCMAAMLIDDKIAAKETRRKTTDATVPSSRDRK